MDNLEKTLFDFTGNELHELAWYCKFPINQSVALSSFFSAFQSYHGISVLLDDKDKQASFNLVAELGDDIISLTADLSYDEISQGWKRAPRNSLMSLYDSIYAVYDKMELLLRDHSKPDCHSPAGTKFDTEYRNNAPRAIRVLMENSLLNYFRRYHEHVFAAKNGKEDKLASPRIFFEVLKSYPIEMLRTAIINPPTGGPCGEFIMDRDWQEFEAGKYHPSESSMMDLFWGMYLQKLAKEKGYSSDSQALRYFVSRGRENFKPVKV